MRQRRAFPLLVMLWLMFSPPLVSPAQEEEMAALRKKAEEGDPAAQYDLGLKHAEGEGVETDAAEAVRWYRKAAEQDHAPAQVQLGWMHANGQGVEQDAAEAVKWYQKAADQNHAGGQLNLGWMYANGQGAEKDYARAYFYYDLAARTDPSAARNRDLLKKKMSPQQMAEAQRLLRERNPPATPAVGQAALRPNATDSRPAGSGTGFAITEDGFIVTSALVVRNAAKLRVLSRTGLADATVVRLDATHELALLKVDGRFAPLPVVASRSVELDSAVATVGFPSLGLQGFAPKPARGQITALTGLQDDPRHFQINAPVQAGNVGGALVDERGNVIGVIVALPGLKAANAGAPAADTHCAVRSTFLLGFLESLPDVIVQLREPNTDERPFEAVVKDVEKATVLVLTN